MPSGRRGAGAAGAVGVGRLVGAGRTGAAAALLLAVGCSHLHWPWHHAPPPPAAPVHELDVSSSALDPAAVRQWWRRNTLMVDLSAANGAGSLVLRPAGGATWPVRLGVRVTPGAIGRLEVQGDQRLSLPIAPAAGAPLDLELAPGTYTAKTREIRVTWDPGSSPLP